MSTAVYLAAGCYMHRLAVEERVVPVTARTVHRLVLACLRVAMKALEDLRYPQARFAGVGGVREKELRVLEISLCYLTDFELQVSEEMLGRKTRALWQAAQHAAAWRARVPDELNLKLPVRRKGG
ncbi:cyclin-domain-containing protein [Lineolata rhizophorae]|uniref:Cyclin-domain-containing protein n=1 Tax=Lineolata rhizophorae TaxID=578093 RepID=A0A6A6NUQ0_9PEZI|nr:cyclin-domain-containing protein [Lineolata rhizophorae]